MTGIYLGTVTDAGAQETTPPETCSVCHSGAGDRHQASYDALYQDGVIKVTGLAYSFRVPNTTVVTFRMTKNGTPFNPNDADSLAIMFAPYNGTTFEAADRLSLKGKITTATSGLSTSTLVGNAQDVSRTRGLIVLYGTDEVVGRLPAHIQQGK